MAVTCALPEISMLLLSAKIPYVSSAVPPNIYREPTSEFSAGVLIVKSLGECMPYEAVPSPPRMTFIPSSTIVAPSGKERAVASVVTRIRFFRVSVKALESQA